MAYSKRVKKPIYVSVEEKRKDQEIIQKSIKPKKQYKAQITFRKQKSKIPYVLTGYFLDENDAQKFSIDHLTALNDVSGNQWRIINIEQINSNDIEMDVGEEQ